MLITCHIIGCLFTMVSEILPAVAETNNNVTEVGQQSLVMVIISCFNLYLIWFPYQLCCTTVASVGLSVMFAE